MIRPGLERIGLLMKDVPLTWNAIHVAGTNGKGSVCTYISNMLNELGVRTGRFVSPHFIDRWDCISIEERPVSQSKFREAEDVVKWRNDNSKINASEFELLTATAFEIFNRERVDIAVVECGMGGRDDATNILDNPLLSVITSLGMDHQQFLGSSEGEIARAKAGIMKPGVHCVVMKPQKHEFEKGIRDHAAEQGFTDNLIVIPESQLISDLKRFPIDQSSDFLSENVSLHIRSKNRINAVFAEYCITQIREQLGLKFPQVTAFHQSSEVWWTTLDSILASTKLPGRSQLIDTKPLTGREARILIDGAHNVAAFEALKEDLDNQQALGRIPPKITWLLSSSQGRDPKDLKLLVNPSDNVLAVEFGPVDGMPWVKPNPSKSIALALEGHSSVVDCGTDVKVALLKAASLAGEESLLIVTGSFYLLSNVLRVLRDAGCDTGFS